MALTVPYNSAMRLGMGFNSYTQSLCVNDIVRKRGNVPATEKDLRSKRLAPTVDVYSPAKQPTADDQQLAPRDVLEGANGTMMRKVIDGQKEVSQIVTWKAEFVDSSSEILEKLDVSGALSIKLDGLGKISGNAKFLDSTKVNKADVKYFINVTVTNERLIGDDVTEFCPIENIPEGKFTELYGDCFISGFEEGGEFNALILVSTDDTDKKWSLSGGASLEAKVAGLDVRGEAQGGKDDNKLIKKSKTEITVSWSGGGDIRDDKITEWNMKNLKEIAMAFPDAVSACPRRTKAILTKYTSLRSYYEQTVRGSPLDYENAGVYTASLYEAYTQYKMMWKDIQTMLVGLNKRELALYMQESSPGLIAYATKVERDEVEKTKHYEEAVAERMKRLQDSTTLVLAGERPMEIALPEKPLPANKVQLYSNDVFGLEIAAADCRFEMIKIVREVDAVTKDPKVACDPHRSSQYLSANVFQMLLPTPHKERLPTHQEWLKTKDELTAERETVEAKKKEIETIKKQLEIAMITPRRTKTDTLFADASADITTLHPRVQSSISEHAYKAGDYRMQSKLSNPASVSTGASFFNDLDSPKLESRPTALRFWYDKEKEKIKGFSITHAFGDEIKNGQAEGDPQNVLMLSPDEAVTELEVYATKTADAKRVVTAIALATSKCNILTVGDKSKGMASSFSIADHRQWSLRGFFGFTSDGGFEDLGVVWGHDVVKAETTTVQMPPAKNLLGMGPSLREKARAALSGSKPAEHFYLGDCISTESTTSSSNSFSALEGILASSKICKLAFSASSGRLSGLKVGYKDGRQLIHGAYSPDWEVWQCEVSAPIIAARLTTGKIVNFTGSFVDTVELVCGEANGDLPSWPLDVSTVRYLGDHPEADRFELVTKLTEQAPKFAEANWTLRGFYGEESQGIITRLGLIWGCA